MNTLLTKRQVEKNNLSEMNLYVSKLMGMLIYADSEDEYKKLLDKYIELFGKISNSNFIWTKNFFIFTIKNHSDDLKILDRNLISRIINYMYQQGRIYMIPCSSFVVLNPYYAFFSASYANNFLSFKQELLDALFKNKKLNTFDYSKSIFKSAKGSVYWIKAIFDHLVFLGYAEYIDSNNIKLGFKKEWTY